MHTGCVGVGDDLVGWRWRDLVNLFGRSLTTDCILLLPEPRERESGEVAIEKVFLRREVETKERRGRTMSMPVRQQRAATRVLSTYKRSINLNSREDDVCNAFISRTRELPFKSSPSRH